MLITPSAICQWWGAARAIVMPQQGGVWAAAWGDEDDPDYISIFQISVFDPPGRLVFSGSQYYAKDIKLPFEADFTTEFLIEPSAAGCSLQATQEGFPCDPIADDFYAACETGWKNTFAGIRSFLAAANA